MTTDQATAVVAASIAHRLDGDEFDALIRAARQDPQADPATLAASIANQRSTNHV